MASWLSSKLKVAEHLLNQIDQQAAGSLGQAKDPQDPFFRAPIERETSNGSAGIFGDPLVPEECSAEKSKYQYPDLAAAAAPRYSSSSSSIRESSSRRPEKEDWTELLSTSSGSSGEWKKPATIKGKIQKADRVPARKILPAKRSNATRKVAKEEKSSNGVEDQSKDEKNKAMAAKDDPVENDYSSVNLKEDDPPSRSSSMDQTEEQFLACRAAIEDRAAFVERLEEEKQALEALVAEREEQQRKEAAELRAGMVELIQAADLEKQRHSHTRMEALARESQLQNESVELAKSLAAAQRKLDAQLVLLSDARARLEMKRVSVFELERKASRLRSSLADPSGSLISRNVNEAYEEKQKVLDDIDYYKAQAENLQAEIRSSRISQQMQSEKERELESRLATLTDHLIQKQTQVEAYSTEKATLLFRLEAYTSQERASKAKRNEIADVEFGAARSGDEMISWSDISSKLDLLFVQGTRVLGMNKTARSVAAAYFLLLHVWVVFIIVQNARLLR